jgi:hypothetical protein
MSHHFIKRIDRIVGEINVCLSIIAIGLAALDVVLLVTVEMPLVAALCVDCPNISNTSESAL